VNGKIPILLLFSLVADLGGGFWFSQTFSILDDLQITKPCETAIFCNPFSLDK
jgi:hypothetical protein